MLSHSLSYSASATTPRYGLASTLAAPVRAAGRVSPPSVAPITGAPRWLRPVRRMFAVLAWVYVAFLVVQVFLAGLGVFVNPRYFAAHRTLVHAFGWLDFLLLALAFVGRFPRTVKRLAITVVSLIGAQYLTIHLRGVLHSVVLGAFHPVSAAFLFAAALAMARRGWRAAWSADVAT